MFSFIRYQEALTTLEELSPEVLRIIGLCSRFLLRRNELVPQLFRLTPDFIF